MAPIYDSKANRSVGSVGAALLVMLAPAVSTQLPGTLTKWGDIIPPGAVMLSHSGPGEKIVWASRIFFEATRFGLGAELFWTDGSCGPYLPQGLPKGYHDIARGPAASNPRSFFIYCEQLFFASDAVIEGVPLEGVLFKLEHPNDTTAAYHPVTQKGHVFSQVRAITPFHNELWFVAYGYSPIYRDASHYPFRMHSPLPRQCVTEMVVIDKAAGGLAPNVSELEAAGRCVAMSMALGGSSTFPSIRGIWCTLGDILLLQWQQRKTRARAVAESRRAGQYHARA